MGWIRPFTADAFLKCAWSKAIAAAISSSEKGEEFLRECAGELLVPRDEQAAEGRRAGELLAGGIELLIF